MVVNNMLQSYIFYSYNSHIVCGGIVFMLYVKQKTDKSDIIVPFLSGLSLTIFLLTHIMF